MISEAVTNRICLRVWLNSMLTLQGICYLQNKAPRHLSHAITVGGLSKAINPDCGVSDPVSDPALHRMSWNMQKTKPVVLYMQTSQIKPSL